MFRRQLAALFVAALTGLALMCAISSGLAGPQDKAKNRTATGAKPDEDDKAAARSPTRHAEKRLAEIEKMIAAYDLKPHPLPSIPDDPPPHEGAMISLPNVIEPPDLVIVEVLDALPGRPISGERLVRPDGKISLGFYGEVDAKGLTMDQLKVAIIKLLRRYLSDDSLGLETPVVEQPPEGPMTPGPPAGNDNPQPKDSAKARTKARPSSVRGPLIPRNRGSRSASTRGKRTGVPLQLLRPSVVRVSAPDQDAAAPAQNPFEIPIGAQGKMTITIELDGQGRPMVEMPQGVPDRQPGAPFGEDDVDWTVVPPAESQMVFVDVTAYNSKNFYILGDVLIAGKLPWTGNETVLDVLQYAGGLLPTAEPTDIRLIRPGRNGSPAKVYRVDLAAIQDKGDVTKNYQIFPNDRLIVGRNAVVQKTVLMDRLAAPIHAATASIHNTANMLRAVQLVDQANSDLILKELVDFWAKEISSKGDLKFDEETLRDALLQRLKPTTTPKK